MKSIALALACCAAALAQPEAAPVKVTKLNSPEKALKFEVVIPGKIAGVWAAFTTTGGLNTWLWKDCTVDLRPGQTRTVTATLLTAPHSGPQAALWVTPGVNTWNISHNIGQTCSIVD